MEQNLVNDQSSVGHGIVPVAGRDPESAETPAPDLRKLMGSGHPEGLNSNSQTRPGAPALAPIRERRTLLVVDDDPRMLEVLVRMLSQENYELLTAPSGPEALRVMAAHQGPIHLLVTDYVMPEMRGRELADRVRARDASVKVLYETGFSDMLFENRVALEEGAAFIEKPFTTRGLHEAVRFILFGRLNPD